MKSYLLPLTIPVIGLVALMSYAQDTTHEQEDSQTKPSYILIQNVNIFDGTSEELVRGKVLVAGNLIKSVGSDVKAPVDATEIDGGGKILMPGLSDAHAHLSLVANPHALRDDLHWMYTEPLPI